jgi:hypothetical protein
MIKKTIKYEDYLGNQREETFYFNLNKAEIIEMQAFGSLRDFEKIANSQDASGAIGVLKDLILKSYGEKSADGKRFIKKAADGHLLADDFAETDAYAELFVELANDTTAMEAFVRGIVPQSMMVEAEKQQAQLNA